MKERREDGRRKVSVRYDRRKFNRRGKVFYYERKIHLGDTQVMGGSVYYAQYWYLIGEAREEYLQFFLGNNFGKFMTSGVNLVTVDVEGKYKYPLFAYDEATVTVKTIKLTRAKFVLKMEIIKSNGEKSFSCLMTIAAFKDKIIKLPDELFEPLSKLLTDD